MIAATPNAIRTASRLTTNGNPRAAEIPNPASNPMKMPITPLTALSRKVAGNTGII